MASLFVASAGGHLEELWLLRRRIAAVDEQVTWVTWDSPQSRSLLRDSQTIFVPSANPRDIVAVSRIGVIARRVMKERRWDRVVSTGSSPAVPFFVLARARGIPCHYIESATRVTGPSLTARLLERVPGVQLYSQQSSWERQGWQYRGSVFDTFESGPRREGEIRKVVVTVGTSQRYGFRRLIERLHAILPSEASVLWQTGSTDTDGLGLEASPYLGVEELSAAMSDADLVVAHAGVGSALTALRAGRCPVLVPRRQSHGEHVDDHQWEVAAALSSRGVAISVAVETLTLDDLREAASRSVVSSEVAAPYVLAGS